MNTKPRLWLMILLLMFPQVVETIYSPALPSLAQEFGVSIGSAAQTLSVYFIAFAVGVLFWGRMADVIGRRKAMLAGLGCYALGATVAIGAQDFSLMLAARVLSAFGAAVGSVVTQTMLRDSYQGDELAKVFSIMGMAIALSPVIGLLSGSALVAYLGYLGVFYALLLLAFVLLGVSALNLPETQGEKSETTPLWQLMSKMLRDTQLLKNAVLVAGFNVMLFGYYALAPFLFAAQGMSSLALGYSGLVLGLGSLLGSYCNKRLLAAGQGSDRLIGLASGLALLGGIGTWLTMDGLYFLLPMMLVVMSFGIAIPNILSRALVQYRQSAGSAGAILGLFYYTLLGLGLALAGVVGHLGIVITCAALVCIGACLDYQGVRRSLAAKS